MVDEIDDGGPAYPIVETTGKESIVLGASMRDYFAASALQGMWAGKFTTAKPVEGQPERKASYEDMAAWAYMMADAMLAARRT